MIARRRLLRTGLGAAGLALAAPGLALAAAPAGEVRRIAFDNLHTGEGLEVAYWENGAYSAEAMAAVDHVMRDWRTGDIHTIDPGLIDLLVSLAAALET